MKTSSQLNRSGIGLAGECRQESRTPEEIYIWPPVGVVISSSILYIVRNITQMLENVTIYSKGTIF